MSDLTIFPADLAAMSVSQLAQLPPAQKAEIGRNLDEALAWLKQARAKFDAALDAAYGEQAREARLEAGKDFGVVHLNDEPLRVTVDLPKRVSWDQGQLAAIAARIAASGERIEDYMDVEFSVSESRFNNWPAALRSQFEAARTVKPGKPSFRLAFNSED
ncbi:hypothetical protein C3497_09835 [Zoogloeaceae bacteirum Par-f-2]|nr:hypothetical protein C3497_09835 [Zoogloeaceae bacteirum Par-f-2]